MKTKEVCHRGLAVVVVCLTSLIPVFGGGGIVQSAAGESGLVGDSFPISNAAHDQLTLALAYNPADNEYLVVWEDKRNAEDQSYEIRGRRVSRTGELLGDDDFLISTAQYPQMWPAVTYNEQASQYLVAWVRWRSIHNTIWDWEWDIYGQVVGSDGTLIGDRFAIATADRRKRSPAVAYCGSADRYLVVWDDIDFVQGQLVSRQGTLIDNPGTTEDETDPAVSFRISDWGDIQVHPDIAYNSQDGEFFVVWRDARDYTQNYNDDIYGQRVSCAGELLVEGDIAISTQQVEESGRVNNGQNGPTVAHNQRANEYLVAWHDGRNDLDGDESDLDIYGQRVSAAGALLDNPETLEDETDPTINFPISRATGKQQWLPDVAYDGAVNGYLVVWTDWRNDNINSDIYGQQVSSAGELLGEELHIADADNNQGNVWFAYDSEEGGGLAIVNNSRDHEYFAAWADYRNESTTGWDIYGWRYELPLVFFLPIIVKSNL